MRRHQQKQILELIQTLNEAYHEIKRLFLSRNLTTVNQLLAESQEFVYQTGTFIENIEGEGTRTVALMEKYHEALYEASVNLSGDADHSIDFIERLGEQLVGIGDSVRKDLEPNKVEVLFLPYKASMFDAFESIWLAARDDPQCEAFVVPIPYFDRLSDGTLGQMHYEGDQYPDYVPVVDFLTYDVEARHPDIIFIHNPYDGGNYVTSVHPDYYSKRLKDHTDLLAYVPYFVVSDDVPESLCSNTGELYADKVFLQSEKVRNTFVRVFREFEIKNNCVGRFGNADSKFVASGSPKFDRAINSKPGDFNIPDEWRRLITYQDGTQKKVVLYNTSVKAIIQGDGQYIKKLRYVLDNFRQRDDVVLWWRPHPLNKATYESILPNLLSEYEQIISDYKREGWGIYDDTSDLHRSICLSSMYFGDRSSLVALYQCTAKPVLIQDVNFTKHDRETTGLVFDRVVEDEKFLWFVSATYNALFRMDKGAWRLEYMGEFPNEKPNAVQLYKDMAKCGDKLFFAPFNAAEAAVFDIPSGRFGMIPLKHLMSRLKMKGGFMFSNTVSYRKSVYFLPFKYPAIVRLDTESGRLEYYTDWLNLVEKAVNNPERGYFYTCCPNGNELILPCGNANAVILFDMDNGTSEIHVLGERRNRYVSSCFDGNDYWFCSIEGSVFRWNKTGNVLKEIISAADNDQSKLMFIEMLYLNGYVWLFPYKADRVIKIDISDNSIEKVNAFDSELSLEESNTSLFNGNFIMSASSGDVIYAHTGKSNHFISYDTLTGEKREEAILPDEKTLAELRTCYYYDNSLGAKSADDCIYNEMPNIHFGIDEFMNCFVSPDPSGKMEKTMHRQTELRRREISNAAGAGLSIYLDCKAAVLEK